MLDLKLALHRLGRPSRAASTGYLAGLVLVGVGATAAVLAAGHDSGPGAPANSLPPGDTSSPPGGSPVAPPQADQAEVIGRFRILPAGRFRTRSQALSFRPPRMTPKADSTCWIRTRKARLKPVAARAGHRSQQNSSRRSPPCPPVGRPGLR